MQRRGCFSYLALADGVVSAKISPAVLGVVACDGGAEWRSLP